MAMLNNQKVCGKYHRTILSWKDLDIQSEEVKHGDLSNLVGGCNHLEKYEFVNGKDYPIYYGKKHV